MIAAILDFDNFVEERAVTNLLKCTALKYIYLEI